MTVLFFSTPGSLKFNFYFKYRDVIGRAWGDGDSLVAVAVLVDVAALRHHALLVQGEGQLQLELET